MALPNTYLSGSIPEIHIAPKDDAGVFFTPTGIILVVTQPDGQSNSFDINDLTQNDADFTLLYPASGCIGYYEYEATVSDSDRAVAVAGGFLVSE